MVALALIFIAVWTLGLVYLSLEANLWNSPELASPKQRISPNQIHVFPNNVVLDLQNVRWTTYADTNSMDPFLDANAHGLEIKPKSPDDIQVGDIVVYRSKLTGDLIVHRVIGINSANSSYSFTLKGDNTQLPDPEQIRFDQIEGVLIGILY